MNTDTATAALYEQARRQSAADPTRCVVPWGVCPEHGGTLRSSADRTVCTDPACFLAWEYDRLDAPCPEAATHTVTADDGGCYVVCDGHAVAARSEIVGGRIIANLPYAH
ncbi:hypothetical protein ACFV1L_21885 [Kitasatospora sp. NPDC059646]|uniref:hypothetical protein n=1 Tax=Kitasatospora sp. NPDC059646 TaxID=3346893 RepID=UPI0036A928CC